MHLVFRGDKGSVHSGGGLRVRGAIVDRGDLNRVPTGLLESSPVMQWAEAVGNARKVKPAVQPIRITVNIVGIMVADPAGMGFQVDFGDDSCPAFAYTEKLICDGRTVASQRLDKTAM